MIARPRDHRQIRFGNPLIAEIASEDADVAVWVDEGTLSEGPRSPRGAAPTGHNHRLPSRRALAKRPHKADQIGLPHRGVIMGEMPVRLVAVWD